MDLPQGSLGNYMEAGYNSTNSASLELGLYIKSVDAEISSSSWDMMCPDEWLSTFTGMQLDLGAKGQREGTSA